ncbi:WAT1-related protein [Dendrobium catenatum]|uniref:WAT1-related protein n=1 Tax=Dendrobium catenatum TaxID=906689 RepID=A0A2I0WCP8_9ASPA|nr:WAT1-related protein [Dendrobium catenatum]
MILLQVSYAGMFIISVATLRDGMNQFVLVVYRNIVAAAVIAPSALWFERLSPFYLIRRLNNLSFSLIIVIPYEIRI